MIKKSLLFPVSRQDKALSQAYFNKITPKPKETEEVKTTLSAEELQFYIDILLEASPPKSEQEKTDHTRRILIERFGIPGN